MSSNSVLRRYTPPTCSLEIVAKGSPLSRWVGRPVLKQVKFLLNFDDPRLPEDQKITIAGDKDQLEALREAVANYVQEFLEQSPQLNTKLPQDVTLEDGEEKVETDGQFNYVGPETDFTVTQTAKSDRPDEAKNSKPPGLPVLDQKIYLQPNGLFSHDLYLGTLATPQSGPVIHLSLLQLFDLATALDEYAAEVDILPNLNRSANKRAIPYWAISAAMVTATVGLSAGILKMLDRENRNPQIVPAAISPSPNPAAPPQVAIAPSPQTVAPTPAVPTPPATSLQTLPSLPPGATNLVPTPTPTPGAVGSLPLGSTPAPSPGANPVNPTPTPPSRVPFPSAPASAPPATITIPGNPPGGATLGRSSVSTSPVVPSPGNSRIASNSGSFPAPNNRKPIDSGTTALDLYKLPGTSPTPTPKTPARNARQNSPAPTSVELIPRDPIAPPQIPQIAAIETPAAKPPAPSRSDTRNTKKPAASETAKPQEQPPAVVSLESKPETVAASPSSSVRREQTPDIPLVTHQGTLEALPSPSPSPSPTVEAEKLAALRSPAASVSPSPVTSPATASETLFDQIPQVAEARKYFQQRWQPPSRMTQDQVEYTISLNADGSIKQVTPRGQVAQIYLDRTQIPLKGEPFVSPVEGGRSPDILLILHKNGKVETRLQSLN